MVDTIRKVSFVRNDKLVVVKSRLCWQQSVLLTTLLRIRYELYWGLCLGPVQHGGHGEFLFSLIHIYKVTRRPFMIGSPLDNALWCIR